MHACTHSKLSLCIPGRVYVSRVCRCNLHQIALDKSQSDSQIELERHEFGPDQILERLLCAAIGSDSCMLTVCAEIEISY